MNESHERRQPAVGLERLVESSLWKLLQPVMVAIVVAMLQQVMGRLDRMEAAQNETRTAQALTAQRLSALDASKIARDAELAEVHRIQAEQAARLAVLEAKMR